MLRSQFFLILFFVGGSFGFDITTCNTTATLQSNQTSINLCKFNTSGVVFTASIQNTIIVGGDNPVNILFEYTHNADKFLSYPIPSLKKNTTFEGIYGPCGIPGFGKDGVHNITGRATVSQVNGSPVTITQRIKIVTVPLLQLSNLTSSSFTGSILIDNIDVFVLDLPDRQTAYTAHFTVWSQEIPLVITLIVAGGNQCAGSNGPVTKTIEDFERSVATFDVNGMNNGRWYIFPDNRYPVNLTIVVEPSYPNDACDDDTGFCQEKYEYHDGGKKPMIIFGAALGGVTLIAVIIVIIFVRRSRQNRIRFEEQTFLVER